MGNFAENLNLGKRVLPPWLGKSSDYFPPLFFFFSRRDFVYIKANLIAFANMSAQSFSQICYFYTTVILICKKDPSFVKD